MSRVSDLAMCVAPLPHCLVVGAVLDQCNGGVAAVSLFPILLERALQHRVEQTTEFSTGYHHAYLFVNRL